MSDTKDKVLVDNNKQWFDELVSLRQQLVSLHEAVRKSPQEVVIFVDNTNLNLTARKIDPDGQYRVDYYKLREILTAGRRLKQARIYYSDFDRHTSLPPEDEMRRREREGFYGWLKYQGFWLKCLPLVERCDGTTKEKGLDAAIIKDIERLCAHHACGTVVLVAGDADYKEEVQEIQSLYGMRVEVAFFGEYTAKSLQFAATEFIDLMKVKQNLRR